ncbi:hypothetical protein KBB96_15835 [Luteolibacter ambystomatis]|uniref:DUF1549 domain-containing protein n=1 Tax=Luteolibacter ambystomatis TaxID=2824561 RepID=A0A975G7P8_9BACT|nr:hypothetical protein [Luteolibacter ambystomatis]QUE50332.1 hypothetical protein KBB96_15835 [Luteolibacter ambystomatis]
MTPKPKRWSFWLVSATALLSIGAWQAAQIAVDAKTRAMAAVKVPPKKTRSDGRKPSAKELAQIDPVGTYIARAKRGMTDQEINWMIEDFHKRGLDKDLVPDTVEHYQSLRQRQAAWYLQALAEGFSLSPSQKSEAAARLRRWRLQGDEEYAAKANEPDPITNNELKVGDRAADYAFASQWLFIGDHADPSVLCDLTPEQKRLTYQDMPSGIYRNYAHDLAADQWIMPPNATLEPKSSPVAVPDIFPLMPSQLVPPGQRSGGELAQARRLQPAQLRIILLFHREIAAWLSDSLEKNTPVVTDPLEPQAPHNE